MEDCETRVIITRSALGVLFAPQHVQLNEQGHQFNRRVLKPGISIFFDALTEVASLEGKYIGHYVGDTAAAWDFLMGDMATAQVEQWNDRAHNATVDQKPDFCFPEHQNARFPTGTLPRH
eukprot:6111041-Amphidinium_carterae.2